ncbi:hypothetical protein [Helicobacter bilis]|uniref:hypothetical protein n=1 Tax=Helicobacter bilis TaxID=37372 RepID=UPI002557CCCC|nr:hypothetical protein [Helicobacter bilis]
MKLSYFFTQPFNHLRFYKGYCFQLNAFYRILNKISQILALLFMLLLSTFSSIYAKDTEEGLKNSQEKITEANGLIGIPEDDRKNRGIQSRSLYIALFSCTSWHGCG